MLITTNQLTRVSKLPRATGKVDQVVNSGRLEELILQRLVTDQLFNLKLLQLTPLGISYFAKLFFLSLLSLETLLPRCIGGINTLV